MRGYAVLDGVKVLELASDVAAAYCGRLLQQCGADVHRVKHPQMPTLAAALKAAQGGLGSSASDLLTANKPALEPDRARAWLQDPSQKPRVVVVDDGTEAWARKFHVMPREQEEFTNLVAIRLTHFGSFGPHARWSGSDLCDFAASGLLHSHGYDDRHPIVLSPFTASISVGGAAFGAGTAALFGILRDEARRGGLVEVAAVEVLATCHVQAPTQYEYLGTVQGRGAAAMSFACSDGFVSIALQQHLWDRFCQWLDIGAAADDPRFLTWDSRIRHLDLLEAIIQERMSTLTKEDAYHSGQAHGIPVSFVHTLADVLRSPQLKAMEFWDRSLDIQTPSPPFVVREL